MNGSELATAGAGSFALVFVTIYIGAIIVAGFGWWLVLAVGRLFKKLFRRK